LVESALGTRTAVKATARTKRSGSHKGRSEEEKERRKKGKKEKRKEGK